MDWSVFHFLNSQLEGHDGWQDLVEAVVALSVPVFVAATALLWLADRPGRPLRWRLATISALASAGLALLINQLIADVWLRDRPFTARPSETLLLTQPSADPSFPSDHASAAFAIAFAVLLYSRTAGAVFLLGAVVVALSRVFIGLHYPGDVAAGAVVGLACAGAVAVLLKQPVRVVTRLVSRLTDPLVSRLWAVRDRTAARLQRPSA